MMLLVSTLSKGEAMLNGKIYDEMGRNEERDRRWRRWFTWLTILMVAGVVAATFGWGPKWVGIAALALGLLWVAIFSVGAAKGVNFEKPNPLT